MSWPIQDLSDEHLSSASDSPARARNGILRMLRAVQAIIGARGTAGGVASLDSRGRVPAAELGRGVEGGVAALDHLKKVPGGQLPLGIPGGVAPLDDQARLPAPNLPFGILDGVARLDDQARVPSLNLPRGIPGGVASLDDSGTVPSLQIPTLDAAHLPPNTVRRVRVTRRVSGNEMAIEDVSLGASIVDDELLISLHITRRTTPPSGHH